MSSKEIAISLQGIEKVYRSYPSKRARLLELLSSRSGTKHTLFRVLRGVDLIVEKGESVGIIGSNGAGKSTLLKIIAGVTRPSAGSFEIHGRVTAMLELGIGFHPDFSGRHNAMMALAIQGYSASEAEKLLPEVFEFSELGAYFDEPLRTYSSGMQVRLGFAVATSQRPDILIVDEALSVGDAYFQQKSFARIRHFRELGTTLLLVSHDKTAVQAVCDRAVLIHEGRMAKDGDPETVFNYYSAIIASRTSQIEERRTDGDLIQTSSGTQEAVITDVALLDSMDRAAGVFNVGSTMKIRVKAQVNAALPKLVFGIQIKDRLGQCIFGTNTFHMGKALSNVVANSQITATFALPLNIGAGQYSVTVALSGGATHLEANYHWLDRAGRFDVVNGTKPMFVGSAFLDAEVDVV